MVEPTEMTPVPTAGRGPGPTCVVTSPLALGQAPEVVGIAEAAAVEEVPAPLSLAVEEEALHQTPTGTGSLR